MTDADLTYNLFVGGIALWAVIAFAVWAAVRLNSPTPRRRVRR